MPIVLLIIIATLTTLGNVLYLKTCDFLLSILYKDNVMVTKTIKAMRVRRKEQGGEGVKKERNNCCISPLN